MKNYIKTFLIFLFVYSLMTLIIDPVLLRIIIASIILFILSIISFFIKNEIRQMTLSKIIQLGSRKLKNSNITIVPTFSDSLLMMSVILLITEAVKYYSPVIIIFGSVIIYFLQKIIILFLQKMMAWVRCRRNKKITM